MNSPSRSFSASIRSWSRPLVDRQSDAMAGGGEQNGHSIAEIGGVNRIPLSMVCRSLERSVAKMNCLPGTAGCGVTETSAMGSMTFNRQMQAAQINRAVHREGMAAYQTIQIEPATLRPVARPLPSAGGTCVIVPVPPASGRRHPGTGPAIAGGGCRARSV